MGKQLATQQQSVPTGCAVSMRSEASTQAIKAGRMGRSDKVSLWCVSLSINTRFRFFILE